MNLGTVGRQKTLGGWHSGTHLPFWASPGLGELGPQAQHARRSPLLESSRRLGDCRPHAWPGSAGSTVVGRGRGRWKESELRSKTLILVLPS